MIKWTATHITVIPRSCTASPTDTLFPAPQHNARIPARLAGSAVGQPGSGRRPRCGEPGGWTSWNRQLQPTEKGTRGGCERGGWVSPLLALPPPEQQLRAPRLRPCRDSRGDRSATGLAGSDSGRCSLALAILRFLLGTFLRSPCDDGQEHIGVRGSVCNLRARRF